MSDRELTLDACTAPVVYEGTVLPEWIDINNHMNVAYYMLAFDYGIDALWHGFGLSDEYRDDTGSSTFAVEAHIRYLKELVADEGFVVCARILAWDDKRLHQFQYLFDAATGALSATCEWLHLHVDLGTRRVSPWPERLIEGIAAHPASAVAGDWPEATGRQIKVVRPLGPVSAGDPS
ncbi:MAG: thioesterase family protein [Pseudomonadota bacterium]